MICYELSRLSKAIATSLIVISCFTTPASASERKTTPDSFYSKVSAVIDGDTIEIAGSGLVRYLGIDTPEAEQPFYDEAKRKNSELVLGKTVRIEVCKNERTDKYGRLLAYVYADKNMVNKELLKYGYARILFIPPCGAETAEEFRQYQKEAMAGKAGIWGNRKKVITQDYVRASEVSKYIGSRKAVYGRINRVQRGKKTVFLHMGNTRAKTALNIVIFNQDIRNFEDNRINPLTYYQGKDVTVYGMLKLYKGTPEIIIGSPSQIEVR